MSPCETKGFTTNDKSSVFSFGIATNAHPFATNASVCKNRAIVKSYGAMPKLENPSMSICGIVGICPHSDAEPDKVDDAILPRKR